jgi:light-regulated signal transduction histidine kinase (bacteriophytochrome)
MTIPTTSSTADLDELARVNRELQQFAYVVSHDLQAPMRAVEGYCQILQERFAGQLDAEADECLAGAARGARQLRAMVNGILSYSRIVTHGHSLQPTDSTLAVEQALANLKAELLSTPAAVTRDPLPVVLADAAQLTRVFQELIGNAVTFRGASPPGIHIGAEHDGGMWRFHIRDNGIGVAPADADRIFLIFQRLHTQDEIPGIGLGLAISRRIVERHGGRMWVESAPGAGSTFLFTLHGAAAESDSQ